MSTFVLPLIYQGNRIYYDKIVFCTLIDQKYRRILSTSYTCAEYRPHISSKHSHSLSFSLLLKSNHASQAWIFSHILVERLKTFTRKQTHWNRYSYIFIDFT